MYVLILTMAVKVFNAGVGGVSMHDFDSYESCVDAGNKWQDQVASRSRISREELSFLCVKK